MKKTNIFLLIIALIIIVALYFLLLGTDRADDEDTLVETDISTDTEAAPFISDEERTDAPLEPISIPEDVVIPENLETLEQLITEIEDEYQLVTWLNQYFSFTEVTSNQAQAPADTISSYSGNALDIAVLVANVMKPKSQISTVLVIEHEGSDYHHAVAVWRGTDLPKYLTLTANQEVLMYHHGFSFDELMRAEASRLDTTITRYFYSITSNLDLGQPRSPYSWQIFN